jgi:hypothetical protein
MLTDPLGRALTSLFRFSYVSLLIAFDTILFAFLLWVSIQGYAPPLPSPWGGWFIVAVNGIFALVFGYVETVIYQLVAVQNPPRLVQSVSRYVALTNQVCSLPLLQLSRISHIQWLRSFVLTGALSLAFCFVFL